MKAWLPQITTGTIFTGAIAVYLFHFLNQIQTLERFNFAWEWALIIILISSISFGITLSLKQTGKLNQIALAILPSLTFLTLFLVANRIFTAPFWDWNAARLSPTFALVKGYQLYYGPDHGSILNTIYGPVPAIYFLPATLLNSFNGAIILAASLSAAITLIPIAYILVGINRAQNAILSVNLWLGTCLYSLADPSLNYSSFVIHVDAPALGLGALAAIFLIRYQRHKTASQLLLSALFAVLSVWSKQVMLPLILVLPLYLGLSNNFTALRQYLVYLLGILLGTTTLFSFWFGIDNMIFNLWQIPTAHGWINGANNLIEKLELALNTVKQLISQSSQLWLAGLVMVLLTKPRMSNLSQWCATNPWLIFFLSAIALIPPSIISRVKIGGDINAFSFTIYFLLMGCFSLGCELISTNRKSQFSAKISLTLLCLILITHLPNFTTSKNTFQEVLGLADNPRQKEFLYLRNQPGSIYFPWNPLAGLMAEGKLYHFSYALYDRELASFPITQNHFERHLPASFSQNQLKVSAPPEEYVIQKYLKNYTKQLEIPELPGFLVYRRE